VGEAAARSLSWAGRIRIELLPGSWNNMQKSPAIGRMYSRVRLPAQVDTVFNAFVYEHERLRMQARREAQAR